MSKPREENPELARVLNRVNALMKHDEDIRPEVATESPPVEPEVPVLTEIYEGEPLPFAPHTLDEFNAVGTASVAETTDDSDGIETILAELLPLIRKEVKKAVRRELVNTEKIVNHRLETEFIQTLLEKLRSEPG